MFFFQKYDLTFYPIYSKSELDQSTIESNIIVKFHKDWSKSVVSTKEKNDLMTFVDPAWPILKLDLNIIKTNILVKFYYD